jgi:small subunit ribosomal protein S16
MLKIRLQRKGSKNKPFYWIVVANSSFKRDGKFKEKVGYYNPKKKDFKLNLEKVYFWIKRGSQLSGIVKYLLKKSKQKRL